MKTPRHFCDPRFKPPVCLITDASVSFASEPQSQSGTSAQRCSAPSQRDDGKTTQVGEQRSRLLSSFFLSIRPSAGLSLARRRSEVVSSRIGWIVRPRLRACVCDRLLGQMSAVALPSKSGRRGALARPGDVKTRLLTQHTDDPCRRRR